MNKIIKWMRQNYLSLVAIFSVCLVATIGVMAYSGNSNGIIVEKGGVVNVENYVIESGEEMVGAASFITSATGYTDVDITNDLRVQGDIEVTGDVAFGDEIQQKGASDYLNTSIDIQAGSATTTFAFLNPYNGTSTAYVKISTQGLITSSTMFISCGTSTGAYEAYDSSSEPDGLIDDYQFVTGTAPVVVDSRDSTTNGTNGRPSVIAKDNEYVKCFAQNDYSGCGSGAGGDYCEQVTSTVAWGGQFPDIIVEWQWRSSS